MTGKMGNKLCGCGLSLNKTLLSLISFILPLRVPVTYVAWLSAALCVVVTMLPRAHLCGLGDYVH